MSRKDWIIAAGAVGFYVFASYWMGYMLFWLMPTLGVIVMKKRIFARGIQKWVNVELVSDNSEAVETVWVSLLIDGEHDVMKTQWKVQGRIMCAGAYHAVKAKDLAGLMDILDNFKCELPNMADETDATPVEAAA